MVVVIWKCCHINNVVNELCIITLEQKWAAGGWFKIKMPSYHFRKSHCGDKTILWPSYLHNGISYIGKMTSLYWIRVQVSNISTLRRALIYQCEQDTVKRLQASYHENLEAGAAIIAQYWHITAMKKKRQHTIQNTFHKNYELLNVTCCCYHGCCNNSATQPISSAPYDQAASGSSQTLVDELWQMLDKLNHISWQWWLLLKDGGCICNL